MYWYYANSNVPHLSYIVNFYVMIQYPGNTVVFDKTLNLFSIDFG